MLPQKLKQKIRFTNVLMDSLTWRTSQAHILIVNTRLWEIYGRSYLVHWSYSSSKFVIRVMWQESWEAKSRTHIWQNPINIIASLMCTHRSPFIIAIKSKLKSPFEIGRTINKTPFSNRYFWCYIIQWFIHNFDKTKCKQQYWVNAGVNETK